MNVSVTGTYRTSVNVEVSVVEVVDELCAMILNTHKIPYDAYVEGGKIVTWDSHNGSWAFDGTKEMASTPTERASADLPPRQQLELFPGSGLTTVEIAHPSQEQLSALATCKAFRQLTKGLL